jgi:superfamily II DNA or RNA helicase/HKD family nuclease
MTNVVTNSNNRMLSRLRTNIIRAEQMMFCVAFIKVSGLKLIENELIAAINRGSKLTILTSTYMNVTEPDALYWLKAKLGDKIEINLFDVSTNVSFHPKGYIFDFGNDEGEVLVGSSNLTQTALTQGIEWNYQIKRINNMDDYNRFVYEFSELYTYGSFALTNEWLRQYAKEFVANQSSRSHIQYFTSTPENYKPTKPDCSIGAEQKPLVYGETNALNLEPIKCQLQALYELGITREEGYSKAMVVIATGLGKTFLSAFDSMAYHKILFVAHREEILRQAAETYKQVHPDKTIGFFNRNEKNTDADIIFASVQTIGKRDYLNNIYFDNTYFEYIVIDEFHHASAQSYMNIVEYFHPQFLLGLTATPDRLDNKDVYKLCDYNIAFECNFKTAINNEWLVPFDYYGIYDEVDYSTIPWKSGKYDITQLENKLVIENRLDKIYEKYINYSMNRTLGFCASKKHCDAMNAYFKNKGVQSEAIHSGLGINRQGAINRFISGKTRVLFVVDIFNEGVDIPCVDTVMFLRPTESYAIFIQQLGRGLRTYEGKTSLRILDFVGNYKNSHLKASYLAGMTPSEIAKGEFLLPTDRGYTLPKGCSSNFDMSLIDYFQYEKKKAFPLQKKLINEFNELKDRLGRVPTIMDVFEEGNYPVNLYLKTFGSWLRFLEAADCLNDIQKSYKGTFVEGLLELMEKTALTKLFKIPTILSLIKDEGIVLGVKIDEVAEVFIEFYKDTINAKEMNNRSNRNYKSWRIEQYKKYIIKNPINYLVKSSSGMFAYDTTTEIFRLNEAFEPYIKKYPYEIGQEVKERLTYRWKDRVKRCF